MSGRTFWQINPTSQVDKWSKKGHGRLEEDTEGLHGAMWTYNKSYKKKQILPLGLYKHSYVLRMLQAI